MIYYFEIPGSLTLTIIFLVVVVLLLIGAILALYVIARLLWTIMRDPLREVYFDYLDRKEQREKTKYSRKSKKKKQQWYEDYSRFK